MSRASPFFAVMISCTPMQCDARESRAYVYIENIQKFWFLERRYVMGVDIFAMVTFAGAPGVVGLQLVCVKRSPPPVVERSDWECLSFCKGLLFLKICRPVSSSSNDNSSDWGRRESEVGYIIRLDR